MLMETPKTIKKDKLLGQKTLNVGGFLDEFEKDDIKKNIDIIELFSYFNVKLSKVGKNFMGLCPWHNDKGPSLSVNREKGLYNCFGCGEAGDVFDLVEKMKGGAPQGFNFKEALVFLKNWTGVTGVKAPAPAVKRVEKTEAEPAADTLVNTGQILNTVKDYYYRRLSESPPALEYLKKRGLKTPELYERFQIGFSSGAPHGTLLEKLGKTQKAALKEAGILNDHEKEHFLNCLVFPIFDDTGAPDGQTVGFYGRDINDDSKFKHRYLKGEHRGIFNRKASKVYPEEIILTECIIDALSLIETGLENVQAIYGTNGFTDEHLETLKADRVQTLALAFDNDEAGRKASEKIKERLLNEGFKVKIISPYSGKDWNEALQNGALKKDDLKALIEQAAVFEKEDEKTNGFSVKEEGFNTVFNFNEGNDPVIYRVSGAKEMFITSLRVNIKAEFNGEKYFDNLDLYSARSRSNYSLHLSRIFGSEPKRIEKDLISILEYFENERDRRSLIERIDDKVEMTEEEQKTGLSFLKSPDLFDQIIRDMEIIGYVGEDLNKELLYLCASSRVLDDPISVLILSESASGKSMLVETIERLMPPEGMLSVTSLSDQALNYAESLSHKFLILGEAVHSDIIEHQIREMLSGKELSRLVTVKDEKTGKMSSRLVKTPMIVASVMSSTNYRVNPENASRCFLINTDESKEQTRKIHEIQRRKYSLDRYFEKERVIPGIIKKHQAAQRLLRNILIVNPFGEALGFPDSLMRTRRDNERFLDLIAVVCFLRQYQKQAQPVLNGSKEYIECDLEDYKVAYNIMVNGVLASTMLELPKSALELYEKLREMARNMAEKSCLKPNEASFTQREIREYSLFGQSWIKQNLRILADFEYITIVRGGGERSKGYYRLREDEDIGKLNLSMIPSPEEIKEKINVKTGQNSKQASNLSYIN